MLLQFDELPSVPEADRIMVRPNRPETKSEGGIDIPEVAQRHANYGTIVAAGFKALDILYDNGGEIGDRIWFGQYAGVIEEWDHLTKAGNKPMCVHDWARAPEFAGPRMSGHRCACGAERRQDPLLIMNVGDILANVDKAARIRQGLLSIQRGITADGLTCHRAVRPYAETITSTLAKHTETTNGAS